MIAIEFAEVVKRYGKTNAVDKVSFSIERGEIVSLLGPSGCGKTTTLRLIGGFEVLDEGIIRIAGKALRDEKPYERNVGLVFQDYALFPHMTVEENVAYGLKRRRMSASAINARVADMLALVKLTGFETRRPSQLSGGQQQRVALARALATAPELLLLDEPLSALDAKLRHELRLDLRRILSTVGTTTIVVTHDQEEAMALGDRIMVMNAGKIEQQGRSVDLYERPRTRFVAEFLGRSNWLEGTLKPGDSDGLQTFVTNQPDPILVNASSYEPSTSARYLLCIRPERLRIGASGARGKINKLTGEVIDVAYLGSDIHTTIS